MNTRVFSFALIVGVLAMIEALLIINHVLPSLPTMPIMLVLYIAFGAWWLRRPAKERTKQ